MLSACREPAHLTQASQGPFGIIGTAGAQTSCCQRAVSGSCQLLCLDNALTLGMRMYTETRRFTYSRHVDSFTVVSIFSSQRK